jgi:hypothetical protein
MTASEGLVRMTITEALVYSFVFGLLHGIIPDEHTWPITFSYAVGGASGRVGMKVGLYFSAAFTVQRMIVSELAYLALAPYLFSSHINWLVYIVVGGVMSVAGMVVLRRNHYLHLHFLGSRHDDGLHMGSPRDVLLRSQAEREVTAPPVYWTILHGFIAGFGFGSFSLFINTVAAPAMTSAWLGFLPGMLFGIGTMIVLIIVGGACGKVLRMAHRLSEKQIRQIGAQTGGRTLFWGGLLFAGFGTALKLGLGRFISLHVGYLIIGLFITAIAIPAFIYSFKEVTPTDRCNKPSNDANPLIYDKRSSGEVQGYRG